MADRLSYSLADDYVSRIVDDGSLQYDCSYYEDAAINGADSLQGFFKLLYLC